jgi:hypothetical protein
VSVIKNRSYTGKPNILAENLATDNPRQNAKRVTAGFIPA